MTRSNIEDYDRGDPLGSVHEKKLTLAAAKARAVRAVAAHHWAEFCDEMLRLGWRYVEDGEFSVDPVTGRPRQYVPTDRV